MGDRLREKMVMCTMRRRDLVTAGECHRRADRDRLLADAAVNGSVNERFDVRPQERLFEPANYVQAKERPNEALWILLLPVRSVRANDGHVWIVVG
jgi:hypothetical protein